MLTNKQALQAYDEIVEAFVSNEPLPVTAVNLLVEAVADVQVRDYILGHAPMSLGAETAVAFITEILPLVDEAKRAPFYTVMSAFYYEAGDSELAYASLLQAQLLDPEYSLANLLKRVFTAGWSAESFVAMREELHPKVVENFKVETELSYS